ncbi:MAG: hypothetical protein SGJ27_13985 [Candidatus Melainabacteria bacterium]|nr:hypothetical protein [Candidatus Melainabacteria bacterium]
MRLLQTALMMAVISGLCIGAPAFAATDFDRGSDLYAKGQFQAASDAFIDAICKNPKAYPAHYALANSYMKLGKSGEAQTEYEMCLEMYPDQKTKSNCQKALLYLNGSTKALAIPASGDGSGQLGSKLAAEGERRAAQAQAVADRQKASIEKNAQKSAERYKDHAKAQIESMKANSSWWTLDREAGTMVPVIGGAEQAAIEMGDKLAEHAVNSAKTKAASVQPSLGTTDATDGLRSQLNASGHSSVRLSPVGTNVYVRNYESNQVAGKSGGVR